MTTYSADTDLLKYRPNILNNGSFDTEWAHEEAFTLINSKIESQWYLQEALEHGVDPKATAMDVTLLDATQLVQLSTYKALELIYISLTKDADLTIDGNYKWAKHFADQYELELEKILKVGVRYDWADDGLTQEDKFLQQRRYLDKC